MSLAHLKRIPWIFVILKIFHIFKSYYKDKPEIFWSAFIFDIFLNIFPNMFSFFCYWKSLFPKLVLLYYKTHKRASHHSTKLSKPVSKLFGFARHTFFLQNSLRLLNPFSKSSLRPPKSFSSRTFWLFSKSSPQATTLHVARRSLFHPWASPLELSLKICVSWVLSKWILFLCIKLVNFIFFVNSYFLPTVKYLLHVS